jgi:hypothetical protein
MAATPITEHPDYLRMREIRAGDLSSQAEREALAALAATTSEPRVALIAQTWQIVETRHAGAHEEAVVLLAETLGLLDRVDLSNVTRSFGRDLLMGLAAGVSSALDVPEVDFAAIDDLIQRLETFAQSLELRPFLLWEVRIRRHAMVGDTREAEFWSKRLLPHVNYTNRFMNGLGCPNCTLGVIAWLRGPTVDPDELDVMFRPVFSGNTNYPGEDRSLLNAVFKGSPPPQCDSGLQLCSTVFGRSLLYAGRFAKAARRIKQARELGPGGVCLLPEIASLELALAMGSPKTIDKACTELTPLAEKHEDIEERFLAQLRIVQAHRTRGRVAPTEAAALSASRLDKRLKKDSYTEQLKRELAEGPPFPLKDAARLPTFL